MFGQPFMRPSDLRCPSATASLVNFCGKSVDVNFKIRIISWKAQILRMGSGFDQCFVTRCNLYRDAILKVQFVSK